MKKIIYLILILIISIFSVACTYGEYDGKEIAAINYVRINYNGGFHKEHNIDLKTNEVLERGYFPNNKEELPNFEVKYTLNKEDIKVFLDDLNKSGLFNIDDEYPSPGNIMDGGGWELNIIYSDGSIKTSKGDNNRPNKVFQKADYAFYRLYGEDLFGTLPSSYKFPPSMDISFVYSFPNGASSNGTLLSSTNATWNKYKSEGINNIEYAKEHQHYEFVDEYDYSFCLWTENYEYKFSKLEIKSYDLNGNDEKVIANTKWFKQKEWKIEFNRVYVVTITYSQGTCEYAFATILSE